MEVFNKILIANRGEIANRIIRTCKKMGIKTVSVYSEADANLNFVKEADEAYCIGKPNVRESYLNSAKIIQIAKEAKVDAIHPGYGFLSENYRFAELCDKERITFIGPKSNIIDLMGDKIKARSAMKKAGVPVVPGSDSALSDLEEAVIIARNIGYPIMIKASAGGGGIGMVLAENEEQLKSSFSSLKKKSEAMFGNGDIFIEKFINSPHHIEVQIACDNFGNGVHLYERDCSIQRRNQKVIEESPSPYLDDELRRELCEIALQGAKKIGFNNIGTMEFIFDQNKNFYFIEMNTRLQVEHPVTEELIGIDLVELQIKLAANQKMDFKQEFIRPKGHSIEFRVYAEDPINFIPSPGCISRLSLPTEPLVRYDFGYKEGDTVTPYYDPMIGKIIIASNGRSESLAKLLRVIKGINIEGINTNIQLAEDVLMHSQFREGNYDTNFLNILKVRTI